MSSKKMVKVRLSLVRRKLKDGSAWPPYEAESVWAEELGNGEYRVANIPFYSTDINFGDIVSARSNSAVSEGLLKFERVLRRSGNSTARVILIDELGRDAAESAAGILEICGCEWESTGAVVAAEVPSSVDWDGLRRELEPFHRNAYVEIELLPCDR